MTLPSQAESKGLFDKFADVVHRFVSRPWFFAICVGIVALWLLSLPAFDDLEKWQLPINTLTTIITFLMVALLENTTKRDGDANQQKLNAIAVYLAGDGDDDAKHELREAVGLEDREGS
jgi:low affinity Fe/Cu permease